MNTISVYFKEHLANYSTKLTCYVTPLQCMTNVTMLFDTNTCYITHE